MKWLVIKNNKECPIEAIEMIGASDKGGGQYIGRFGSGFKQSICAAIRNNIDMRICVGEKTITFSKEPVILSRSIVHRVFMKIDNNKAKERDWTTDMGQHDWKTKPEEGVSVEWMILREFISNAIDEGGCSFAIESKLKPQSGYTKIYLRLTPEIERIVNHLDLYYTKGINSDRDVVASSSHGRVYEKTSTKGRIYCRGVFVRELPEELLYDYDLDHLKLTESRTVDPYHFRYYLGSLIGSMDKEFVANFLKKMTTNDKCFESELSQHELKFSEQLAGEAFTMAFGENAFIAPSLSCDSIEDALRRCGGTPVRMKSGWQFALSDKKVKTYSQIIDKNLIDGYEFIEDSEVFDQVDEKMLNLVKAAYDFCLPKFSFMHDLPPSLKFFKWRGNENIVLGCFKEEQNIIGINCQIPLDNVLIFETMIEEMAHASTRASDLSRQLVASVCRFAANVALWKNSVTN